LSQPAVEEGIVSSTEEMDVERGARTKIERSPAGDDEIIIISSPEPDSRTVALLGTTALQRQLSKLRRQRCSDLHQLIFWAETVAKFGEEVF